MIDAATRIAALEATIAELNQLLAAERMRIETYSASVERMRSIIVGLTGVEVDGK